jgi:quercetin dioxygenase-like cupin family protein
MARVGAEMVNPVTRERFVWRHTAASTGGEFAEFDLFLGQGATLAAAHAHPHQREDFRVERGAIVLRVGGGEEERLEAGAERSIEPGTAHTWGQAGPEEAHVVIRLTPALRSEDFFETFCGLAADGKANKKGLPRNPLQAAVLAHEFRREFALPSPAARAIGGPVLAILARLGRWTGLRATYPAYSADGG